MRVRQTSEWSVPGLRNSRLARRIDNALLGAFYFSKDYWMPLPPLGFVRDIHPQGLSLFAAFCDADFRFELVGANVIPVAR